YSELNNLVTSTENRAPSTEHRVPSTEYRVPSAEYRVPSTECRVPSTEYRVPSTEFSLPEANVGASYRSPLHLRASLSESAYSLLRHILDLLQIHFPGTQNRHFGDLDKIAL